MGGVRTKARILLVDDSAIARHLVAASLTAEGYEVVDVASGEDAIARALSEPFDLVVSDVRMGAITGVQLCRVLRSEPVTQHLPIILLSAADDPRSRFWGRNAGASAYLAKENMLDAVVPAVARLLEGRVLGGAVAPRKGRVDAAGCVSAVMDRHLFEAVLAGEARRLMTHIEDRDAFLEAASALLYDVLGTPYASLSIFGTGAPTCALVAHASLAASPASADTDVSASLLEELGLPSDTRVSHVRGANAASENRPASYGPPERFDLVVKGETIGALRIHGGTKRIALDDRRTAELLADVLAPVVKSILLFEETRRLADTDGLTGLANRRVIRAQLEHELLRGTRYEHPFSVLMLDVDYFKSVNDRFGHRMGDVVLVAVARALEGAVRSVDLIGRWGGEEFVVVLPECEREGARVVAERLRVGVEALPPFVSGPERVTVSCGVATSTPGVSSGAALLELADAALYRAKRDGRNRVELSGD